MARSNYTTENVRLTLDHTSAQTDPRIIVREATPADNDELQLLQEQCPMGTTLVVSVVNTPDFFARAKAYVSYSVLAACAGSRIIGAAACGLRQGSLQGEVRSLGYEFQYFTSPEFARRGVAKLLHQRMEERLIEQGAALSYVLIMEGNHPSMKLFEGLGFQRVRTLVMPALFVYREMETDSATTVRPARPDDLPAIAELLNNAWQGHELYEPASAETLSQFISRTPAYDFDGVLVLEERGKIRACLGFWDWSRIARVTIKEVSLKLRTVGFMLDVARRFKPMPPGPEPGRTLNQMVLTPIGFEEPDHFTTLLRFANNEALAKGIEQVFFLCERGHTMLKSLEGFIRVNTAIHIYAKPFQQGLMPGDNPIFIDGIDI